MEEIDIIPGALNGRQLSNMMACNIFCWRFSWPQNVDMLTEKSNQILVENYIAERF